MGINKINASFVDCFYKTEKTLGHQGTSLRKESHQSSLWRGLSEEKKKRGLLGVFGQEDHLCDLQGNGHIGGSVGSSRVGEGLEFRGGQEWGRPGVWQRNHSWWSCGNECLLTTCSPFLSSLYSRQKSWEAGWGKGKSSCLGWITLLDWVTAEHLNFCCLVEALCNKMEKILNKELRGC